MGTLGGVWLRSSPSSSFLPRLVIHFKDRYGLDWVAGMDTFPFFYLFILYCRLGQIRDKSLCLSERGLMPTWKMETYLLTYPPYIRYGNVGTYNSQFTIHIHTSEEGEH